MDSIVSLLEEKSQIVKKLETIIYGSIEIRENKSNKYIYVHHREDGILLSKYAGEFSNELYNLIIENNAIAQDLKRKLKEINKQLSSMNYIESELSPEIELNIVFAKRNLVDSIYKQSVLEGVATTYSNTETLINEGKVSNMSTDDISKVINLKHAWEFIYNKGVLQYPSSYTILCQINSLVEDGFSAIAGKLRTVSVTIGGCSYIPPFPIESVVKEELNQILQTEDDVERSIKALLYVMKKQLFLDGNKRTAVLFANHILISKAKGLIVIPAEKVDEFKKLLINYYEGKDELRIKEFLLREAYIPLMKNPLLKTATQNP